jgi:hypothetical protein
MIGEGSLTPHQSKVETIRTLRTPANVSELRSVIGFMNYYRVYLPSFSTMCAPLNELLKKGVPWEWGPAQAASYQALKEGLCKEGNALKRFSTDPGVQTVVYTDWSGVGIGAVLGQIGPDGQEHMVACISRSLNKHERNYSSYAGEMLACVWAVKSFRHYLHGISFQICTDHQPLTWLMRTAELQGKHARWAMLLQEYDFQIVYNRLGLQHQNADVLSRFPSPTTYDPTGACLDPEQCSPPSPASFLALVPACLQTWQAVEQAVYEAVFTAAPVSGFMDSYAPAAADVLQGNMGTLGDVGAPEPELNAPVVAAEQQHLRQLAAGWVHGATEVLQRMRTTVPQPLLCGPDISVWGSREVQQLSTVPVGGAVFQAAMQKGVTLYEPFGGMCSGLDSLLANGFTVARYLYSDVDPAAVAVAQHRLDKLHGLYPVSFPLSASADAFTALPADVTAVGAPALVSAGALDGTQWVVVAGWSCQDLSRGGAGLGLDGSRSCTFYDAVRIVGALQQMQPVPPAFIFENTYMQDDDRHSVRESFNIICRALGQPVVVDAARFGAFAHRARNYWSNMASPQWVQAVCDGVQRAPDRFVNSVLDVGREVAFQQNPRSPPFYSCNAPGAHVSALPTLVARPSSWSFRSNGTGMIRDLATGVLSEPNPDERERLMGFSGHDTAAPGVAPVARHAIVGNAMDRFTTTSLFAIYGALGNFSDHLAASAAPYQRPRVCCAATWEQLPAQPGSGGGKGEAMLRQWGWAPGRSLGTSHSPTALQQPVHIRHQRDRAGVGWNSTHEHCFVSSVADDQDPAVLPAAQPAVSAGNTPPVPYPAGDTPFQLVVENAACDANAQQAEGIVIAATGADADVWADPAVIQFLTTGDMPPTCSAVERRRVRKRALVYSMREGVLRRVMANGTSRIVPPVNERFSLVKDTHDRCGHFGMQRTEQQLLAGFWWIGLRADVRAVVSACAVCSQVKASFGRQGKDLHPLPIEGYCYRWGADLAGPFVRSKLGNVYAMICVEYFSKQIEVIALPNKSAECTAAAFLSAVICRYGACAEVVTDGGSEWKGAFDQLMEQSLIHHRVTSPNHPQADGLAERAVQTIKSSLAKLVLDQRCADVWDQQIQWVALGYRASKQASTKIAPYEFLFGCSPVLPPAVKPRFDNVLLDFENPEAAAQYLLERAALLNRHCVMAMSNLRIAQHRDTLQYQRIRSGSHRPALAEFAVGDLVHVRRINVVNTLQSEARPGVYQVAEVRDSGVLIVQGRCGKTMPVHVQNCSPCHLANIDTTINPSLRLVGAEFLCEICETPDDEGMMLVCDSCGLGFHTYCLRLPAVPADPLWVCPVCTDAGVTPMLLEAQRLVAAPLDASAEPDYFPTVKQQLADERAASLDGVWVSERRGRAGHLWGQLVYIPRSQRGSLHRRPFFFRVPGQDQDRRITLVAAEKLHQEGVVDALVDGMDMLALPAGPFVAAATVVADLPEPYAELPDVFELSTAEGVQVAFTVLMQFDVPVDFAGRVALLHSQFDGDMVAAVSSREEVALLLRAVDLQSCARMVCSWPGGEVLAQCLAERYAHQLKVPALNTVHNQFQPLFYKRLASRAPVDWVFLNPPVGAESLALQLAVHFARIGVAMIVDRDFLHVGQASRVGEPSRKLLFQYKAADRLAVIYPPGDGRVWVLVFASVGHRTGMLSVVGGVRDGWIMI